MNDSQNKVIHTYSCVSAGDDELMVRNDFKDEGDGGGMRRRPTHCSNYVCFSSTQHQTKLSGDIASAASPAHHTRKAGTVSSPDSSHQPSYSPSGWPATKTPNILRRTSRRREAGIDSHGNNAKQTLSFKEKRSSKSCSNKCLKKSVNNICGQQRQSGSFCADKLVESLTETCSVAVKSEHAPHFPQGINHSLGTVLPFHTLAANHDRYNRSLSSDGETPCQPTVTSVVTSRPIYISPVETADHTLTSPTEQILPFTSACPSAKFPTQLMGNTNFEKVKGTTLLSGCLPVQIGRAVSIQVSRTNRDVEGNKDSSCAVLLRPQPVRTIPDRPVSVLPDVIKSETNILPACDQDVEPAHLKEPRDGRSFSSQNDSSHVDDSGLDSSWQFGKRVSKRGKPKPKPKTALTSDVNSAHTGDKINATVATPHPLPSPLLSKSKVAPSKETDPSTNCILPTVGSAPFDPMAYTLGNTGRSPFGFYHNDKLYLYVPDTDTDVGQTNMKEGIQKGLVAIQPKSKKSPLSLQADQLMGTSEKLVSRIKDSSDTIPVVIMRPKRKAELPPRDEVHRGKETVACGTKHRQKTGCSSTSRKSDESIGKKITPTCHSDKDNDTNPATSAECEHGFGFSDILCGISRIYKQRKDNTKTASPWPVQLKDCYIDMGTRKSFPDKLTLDHQQQNATYKQSREKQTNMTMSCKERNKCHNSTTQVTKADVKPDSLSKSKVVASCSEKSRNLGKGGKVTIKQEPDQLPGSTIDNRMTSLLSQYLVRDNKQSKDSMQQPFKVVLQTEASKTVLMIPNKCSGKVKSQKRLVKQERTEAPSSSDGNSVTKAHQSAGSAGINVMQKRPKTKTSCCLSDHCRPITHRDKKLPKNIKITGMNLRSPEEKLCYSNDTSNTKPNARNSQIMAGCPITTVLGSIGLQRSVKSECKNTPNIQRHWFQGVDQLFYAAGAQINVTNTLTTSQRTTIFTIYFTNQDSFLKSEHGVPSSLPAYLSYSDDHVVTTIFTSRMCSGFFLVTPTGMVKDDPQRPYLYTESALLEPYSAKHPLPAYALCLVIGPLEEDWKISLQLANSLPKRTSIDKVVEHFIGGEECRCLSTSLSTEQIGTSDSYKRRPMSNVQYKQHRDHIDVLSCRCKECNPLSRWRRGKKTTSVNPPSSGDDQSVLNTSTGDEDKSFLNTSQSPVHDANLPNDGFIRSGYRDTHSPIKIECQDETYGAGCATTSPVRLSSTNDHAKVRQMKMVEVTRKQAADVKQIVVVDSVTSTRKQKEGKMVVKMGFPCKRVCDHQVRQ